MLLLIANILLKPMMNSFKTQAAVLLWQAPLNVELHMQTMHNTKGSRFLLLGLD